MAPTRICVRHGRYERKPIDKLKASRSTPERMLQHLCSYTGINCAPTEVAHTVLADKRRYVGLNTAYCSR